MNGTSSVDKVHMLKKILKEATRIEQWQQEVYTALHNIDAAWVTTGTFDVARIPDLDASKITSGTFDVARIPNLDASKITSGTFALDRIPRLDLTKMPLGSSGYFLKGQGTADPIYALLTAADIPALDASKITTGTFDVARIPDLDASKITSGIFDLARIPNIDWSRISANFPRTIAELLSDHDLTHHPLSILPRMDLSHMPLGASGYFLKGQGTADPVYALLTATDIPSLDASKITSGRFELARLPTSATANRFLVVRTANADPVYDALVAGDIPSLDASKITSGTFDVARIPDLDASKIVSGTFDVARIPDLDASKITSGRFPVSRLPDGTSGYVLVGQGAGYDLAWKDISEIAGVITDSQHGTKTGIPFAHHGDWGHYGKIPTSAPTGVSERAYVDSANLYVHDGTSWVLRATKDWNSLINKPSTFPPSAHTHSRSDVTDFWSSPFWTNIPDKPSTYPPSAHTHARADVTDFWSSPFWGNIPDKPSTFPPSAHASSHASGGADAVSLDASQITSGRLSLSRIPTSATANRILLVRTANADPVYDALVAGDIPSLDASKIVSGTFDVARIPNLDASKITTGTFDVARIPDLDASKITSGVFDVARIPGLDASKIISGTFDVARIPDLDASKITSGRFVLARLPTSATANRFLAVRTANADPIYDALVAGDIPSLDASKIVSGIFDEARIPHTFNLDVTFNSRGLGAGLRMLYAGDETEKSVSGTTETEIKTFRMIYNTSHGRKYTRVYFIGEAYVTGGTGYMKVSIDGAASTTVWTITATSYALHEGYIDVSWSDDSIHTVSVRLANSGSYTTYNRTLEVYTE